MAIHLRRNECDPKTERKCFAEVRALLEKECCKESQQLPVHLKQCFENEVIRQEYSLVKFWVARENMKNTTLPGTFFVKDSCKRSAHAMRDSIVDANLCRSDISRSMSSTSNLLTAEASIKSWEKSHMGSTANKLTYKAVGGVRFGARTTRWFPLLPGKHFFWRSFCDAWHRRASSQPAIWASKDWRRCFQNMPQRLSQ